MSARERTLTISGAGLAGSLLAVLLQRHGIPVRVLESRPDLRRGSVSAGRSINLALANRGIHALERAGVMVRVRSELIPMRGRMIHETDGRTELQPYGSRAHECIYSVGRGQLNGILLDAAEAAGAEILFQHPVDRYDTDTGELVLEDGRRFPGPVIACDGAGSPVRRSMQAAGLTEVSEEKLSHSYKELHIPPAADGSHALDPEALHIWPRGGYMLIALPNTDGSFTVTLFLPDEGDEISFATLSGPKDVEELFERDFPDARALMPTLLDDYFANPTGSLGTVRTRRWVHGETVLLGDAAHAIVPFHGQGMNCAFEDCAAMEALLEELGPDWPEVFRAFQSVRQANAEAIADMALENYVEMRDSVRDPRFVLMKQLAFELERRLPDRFVPRYSMVMFHHVPYVEARLRGAVQRELLAAYTEGKSSLEEVDVDAAEAEVRERLAPIMEPPY